MTRNSVVFIVVLSLALIGKVAAALEPPTGDGAPTVESKKSVEKGTGLLISGITLTGLATIGQTFGLAVIALGAYEAQHADPGQPTMSPGIEFFFGGVLLGGSSLIAAVGLPLMVAGIKRRVRWKTSKITPQLSISSQSSPRFGTTRLLTASWRF